MSGIHPPARSSFPYILLVDLLYIHLYSIVKSKLFGFNPNFGGFDPQIRCLNVLSWSSETLSSSLFAKIFIRNPGIPSYWEPGSLPLLWMEEILRHLGW
jgi:hypothetical protein